MVCSLEVLSSNLAILVKNGQLHYDQLIKGISIVLCETGIYHDLTATMACQKAAFVYNPNSLQSRI